MEHYLRAGEVRDAAIRGDLATVRDAASWMLEHDELENLPPWTDPFVEDFQEEARVLASVDRMDEAAMGTGRLLRTCGACHEAAPGGPTITFADEVPGGEDAGSHMVRHFWGTERMASGLVGPLEDAWDQGLEALIDEPLDPADLSVNPARQDEAGSIATRLHGTANEARSLTNWDERAGAYGRIVYQCASCHTLRDGG